MKYWRYIATGLILAFLVYLAINKKRQPDFKGAANQQWETKIDEREPVSIDVTPLQLGSDKTPWKFEIIIATHSGDLDVDVVKSTTLIDDKGNSFQPTSWEGPGPGGHHIVGNLIFDAITPTPKFIELKIKNIGGIPERIFRWSLE